MASWPSFNNMFEGPECSDFLVERVIRALAWHFHTINAGTIDFAPAVASWIFIVAVVNLLFPRFLPKVLSLWWLEMLFRFLAPYLAFRYLWIPANRFVFFILKRIVGFSDDMLMQWLPFITCLGAIFCFHMSLHTYKGQGSSVQHRSLPRPRHRQRPWLSASKKRRLPPQAALAPVSSARDLLRRFQRFTRSGVCYYNGHY